MLKKTVIVAATVALAACASSKEASQPEPETAPAEEVAVAQKTWDQLEGKEKGKFMKEVVLPTMGDLLKEYDAEEFAEVNCKTCHGESAKERHFEMPTPDLPRLDPTDNFAKEKDHDPAMTKFMMEKFKPRMQELLNEEPYNPETGKGFTCFECHMKEGEVPSEHGEGEHGEGEHAEGEHAEGEHAETEGDGH